METTEMAAEVIELNSSVDDHHLTTSAFHFYQQNGFLILEDFASPLEILKLKTQAQKHIEQYQPEKNPSIFLPGAKQDRYFLESATTIRCFLEPEAVDEQGHLQIDKHHAVNKIGHALHEEDPVFKAFSYSAAFKKLARWLSLSAPVIIQSMYIFKQPRIGAEVPWHQDATFLRTSPSSVVGFWLALDDATVNNGCLYVIPGAHQNPIKQKYRRIGDQLVIDTLDERPWPIAQKQPLEVKAGTLIILDGKLPHCSQANRDHVARHAYTLHMIDKIYPYDEDNWLQLPLEKQWRFLHSEP